MNAYVLFIMNLLTMVGGEVCVDHVRMLLEIPPKYSVSNIMGYIKGKSTVDIQKMGKCEVQVSESRVLVSRILCVDTVGKNARKIAEYIRNQLKEDAESDQL